MAVRWQHVVRHLEQRIGAQARGVVAVLIAGRDHQQPEADDIGQAMNDLIRRSWVIDARGEPIGDTQTLLDLAQGQQAGIGRQQSAIEPGHNGFAGNR